MSLPSKPFLVNWNARDYNPTTHTITKNASQIFTQDLVLSEYVVSYTSDHISVNGQYCDFTFATASDNPFTKSNSDPITIVAKTTKGGSGSYHALCSNRQRNGDTNWMVFQGNGYNNGFFLHNWNFNQSTCPYVDIINEPNIYDFRVSGGTGFGESITDNTRYATKSVVWDHTSQNFSVFSDSYRAGGFEIWNGDFYWLYISNEYLSDEEVAQVISYNEGTDVPLTLLLNKLHLNGNRVKKMCRNGVEIYRGITDSSI